MIHLMFQRLTPPRVRIFLFLSAFLFTLPVYSQNAPDKSGTKPTVLSVPSGPGSITGLGKSFQPQLNTGAASYAITLALPPGPAGFAPSLTFLYNSGFGNGPLGRGWRLSGPLAIERQTEKGFPRYRDTDSGGKVRDVFVFQGEELVPLSDGTYRLENDESFRRFTPIASQPGGAVDAWLIEDRDGARHWLGQHAGDMNAAVSHVVHPRLDDRSPFERAFRWLEDAAEDVNGNRIDYHYQAHADSPGVLYLARVTYHAVGNTDAYHVIELRTETRPDRLADYRSGFERRWARRYREVSVGSHFKGVRHPVRAYALSYNPQDGALAAAATDTGGIGLGISALHALTQFGADRAWGGTGEAGTPLPPTRFFYAPMTLRPFNQTLQDRLSALRYRLRPHEPDPLKTGPVSGQLTQATARGSPNPIFDTLLHDPRVQFADVDGDGLADILDTRVNQGKPAYTVAYNIGDGRFQTSRYVHNPAGLHLGQNAADNQTFLSDGDGDGVIDLFQITGHGVQRRTLIYKNLAGAILSDRAPRGDLGFSAALEDLIVAGGTPSAVDTTYPDARQIDLTFDKIPDILVSSDQGLTGYVAAADGTWETRATAPEAPGLLRRYRFSLDLPDGSRIKNPLVQLADMNGDRLLDLVRVLVRNSGEAEVRYRPMTGPMTWGAEITLNFALPDGSRSLVPASIALPGIRLDPFDRHNRWDALRLIDANGDGLADIVFVETGETVQVYLNAHGVALSGPYPVAGIAPYRPHDPNNPTLLRTADINGNGSVDVLLYHHSGERGLQGIRYLDFIGGQKPGLLLVVDNGIGLRSYIRYKPAIVDQTAAQQSDKPWASLSPVPMWVVSGIVDDIGLDLDLDGDNDRYATTFRYRDPYYDGFEKQFRGFRFVQQIEWGDDIDPATGLPMLEVPVAGHRTTVTRFRFHTGEPDGVDNDDYLDGFDTEPRAAARVIDEKTPLGGREEEALKGKLLVQESVHPLALLDPSADFDACAHSLILASDRAAATTGCTPDRYVYRREKSRWTVRRLYRPYQAVAPKGRLLSDEPTTVVAPDMSVSVPHRVEVETTLPEANGVLRRTFHHPEAPVAAAEPVTLKVDFRYDNFGNVVLERNWGVTSGLTPSIDDERVVRSTYALNRNADGRVAPWILDRLMARRVEDEKGNFVSEGRHFYDGAPFVGSPLGQIGQRGLVSRRENRASDRSTTLPPLSWLPTEAGGSLPGPGDPLATTPEWLVQERAAYDAVGNKIAAADSLARLAADGQPDPDSGHVTLATFDAVFRTFPVEERLWVGDGKPDLVFRAAYTSPQTEYTAAMHWGHGVMTRFWDANGHRSDYLYDRHGRPTAVRSPGDSDALPSIVYTYQPADPHRGLRYDYDRLGRLQLTTGRTANLVITDRRETAGEEEVFRRAAYSTGNGAELLRLEEDASSGYAVLYAARSGLRGTPVFEAQPYRQLSLDFQVPDPQVVGTDLSRDAMGRVMRRRLPPEGGLAPSPRLETRVHYLPLAEWRFDEEDLSAVEPSQDHRGTPLVLKSDGLQRLVTAIEHVKVGDSVTAWPTRYVHDLNDKLTGILDSQGNLRVMRHDGLGRRIALHDVNRGLLRFTYDAANNVVETHDAKGQRITYRYDGLNRMVSEDYHDAGQPFSSGRDPDPQQPASARNRPDVLYTYDAPPGPVALDTGETVLASNTRGFLASVSDLSGEEHLSYDARGRVAWQVKRIAPAGGARAASYHTVMTHDSSDRLTDIQYPDGTQVFYGYDERSRTKHVASPQLGAIIADQTYTPGGLRADITFGNGVLTSRAYDPRLRPREITTVPLLPHNGPPFLAYRYRYDGASNVLAITDQRPAVIRAQRFDNSQQFTYDDLYRLTGAAYDTGRLSLAYDRIGNLTERRFVAAPGALAGPSTPGRIRHGGSAGASNHIGRSARAPGPQAPSSDETDRTYTYDANGNLTQLDDMTLTWDFKDRLVAVERSVARAEYVYDYAGRRVVKRFFQRSAAQRGPPLETHYVSRYFEVVDGQTQRYLFDGETRLARASQSGDMVFYHHDLVASTDGLSATTGALIQSNAFFPFGDVRARYASVPPAAIPTPDYLFAQKERDEETGLSYFEARYLSTDLGRFIRVDPAILAFPSGALETPQLLNGYAFAANNPFKYGDSSGEWFETGWDIVSLGMSISAVVEDPSLFNLAALGIDVAAVVLPGVPGGAGAVIKAIDVTQLIGKTGKQAFGQVNIRRRLKDIPLSQLTTKDIKDVFTPGSAKFKWSQHAKERLKDLRTGKHGANTLKDIENIFNKGKVMNNPGRKGTVKIRYNRLEVIVNQNTRKIITIKPWRSML